MTNESNDLVVTVPMRLWLCWLAEGDLPGDPADEGGIWDYSFGSYAPKSSAGARVYVVAHGFIRGYAPLVRVELSDPTGRSGLLVREGGAVACTPCDDDGNPIPMAGFRGVHRRSWTRETERPFPGWATHGLPPKVAGEVSTLLNLRARGPIVRAALRDLALRPGPMPTIHTMIAAAGRAVHRASALAPETEAR